MATRQGRRRGSTREVGPPQIELRVAARRGAHAARVLREAVKEFVLPGEWVSISLVSDREISRFHLDARGRGTPTDVMSWSPGEVMISLETARRQAREGGWPLRVELRRLLAHAMCHNRGYEHDTPEKAGRMAAAERRMLGREGMVGESLSSRPAAGLPSPRARRAARRGREKARRT
ncbi:MAG: rRNA maturation RNase YbeY [Myxococcales bacterium]|nr:rRNA maturation RNase YbeY [Myxococcales bacterium]